MFAMVLAIGLSGRRDAIVVVENVERIMSEGLTPREATRNHGADPGALVGIAMVLSAVFKADGVLWRCALHRAIYRRLSSPLSRQWCCRCWSP